MKISITSLDKKWSKAVRERDSFKCMWPEGCTWNYHIVQAHHIFPRARRATRHDVDVGISLCPHHHVLGERSAHRMPELFRKLMKEHLGRKYMKLQDKSLEVIR